MSSLPRYIKSHKDGQLKKQCIAAKERLQACDLCPRMCGVNRLESQVGICKTSESAWVSSIHAHYGEEAPLVGAKGSGTIFFTHCNLLCNFCQNSDISHESHGRPVTDTELASLMLNLQNQGCHNINFVTPSHVVPQILSALEIAIPQGLEVPLVYNTGGYDRIQTLRLLDGIIDIYMPDFKFWDNDIAEQTCNAPDYSQVAQWAIKEMHRQVGDLVVTSEGIAIEGLIIRHLVLPKKLSGTRQIMHFLASQISTNTYTNIMPQYRPCYKASQTPGMESFLTEQEFMDALQEASEEGITRLD
ncbi:MAG: pyruvate formate lyase activating enzyme [Candidatus Magnetoglobus multicellularis str. Araruama]|uniref:Pyruvate formate lyase activating enzyme n=1 Tax=Candidatus Magnetoglobus multicellularis str. Araruama TaxID=890399 RepID=A0A1V1P2H7_9BACT|nr:MAG: pyruvate formate lyase activating enzyme [Candidatus Magnetoglobus multicellularis str. Araruama]